MACARKSVQSSFPKEMGFDKGTEKVIIKYYYKMKYRSHHNPTSVHCANCLRDITLEAQEVYDMVILCRECFEEVSDTDEGYDDND
jgi:hypothetical protein